MDTQAININALIPGHMRADTIRRENRLRVHVYFNAIGSSNTIVGGQYLTRPEDISQPIELIIYKSQLPNVLKKVETDMSEVEPAQRSAEMAIRREAARLSQRSVEQLRGPMNEWPETAQQHAKFETIESTEKHLYARVEHSIRPLDRIEVIEELDPPHSLQEEQAAAVASAVVKQIHASSGEMSEMRAMIAAQQKQIEALLGLNKTDAEPDPKSKK